MPFCPLKKCPQKFGSFCKMSYSFIRLCYIGCVSLTSSWKWFHKKQIFTNVKQNCFSSCFNIVISQKSKTNSTGKCVVQIGLHFCTTHCHAQRQVLMDSVTNTSLEGTHILKTGLSMSTQQFVSVDCLQVVCHNNVTQGQARSRKWWFSTKQQLVYQQLKNGNASKEKSAVQSLINKEKFKNYVRLFGSW